MGIIRQHHYETDLNKPLTRHNVGVLLAEGDSGGDTFSVSVMNNGAAENLKDDVSVVAQFIRADGNTVVMEGVNLLHMAQVTLLDACYVCEGRFTLTIKVTSYGTTTTVAIIDGMIRRTTTDSLVDPDETVINIAGVMEAVEKAEAAADRAEEAAKNAGNGGGGGGTGTVTSVNGVEPDADGNVEIDIPAVPTKVSQLTNDKGYLTDYTETDPTVPAWAKEVTKPTYTKSEVGLGNVDNVRQYSANNPPPYPVSSVNGKTGAVKLTADDVGAQPAGNYLTGESDPTVPAWAKAESKPTYSKSEVGLGNVDNVKQYSASNPPPYPVKSVAGKTGAVTLGKLTITGAAAGSYDGSGNVTINIPTIAGEPGKDYSFDPTVYDLPILYLTGDTTGISKDNAVTLNYVYGDRSGTCTLKWQGSSSVQVAIGLGDRGKFNYTIKFDSAFEAKDGWTAQKKYCLKANFIDHSHSRNVVSCKLWGMSVKARSVVPAELASLPNGGAIDGFPCIIMLNDKFHGLYTWNIPKDGWMFGLVEDAAKQQAIVSAHQHSDATQFKGEVIGDESDFELEFVSDESNTAWVNTSLNRLINACVNSLGGDLDDVVGQYLDWDSAIDYYIHLVVDKGSDAVDKNFLLTTFDGVKWYFTNYDRDTICGLAWDGSAVDRPVSNVSFEECAAASRVFELIKRFKTNALKARYNTLRANILSESRINQVYENFAWAIPSPVLQEDVKRWPSVPGSSVNNIDQICRWMRQRLAKCDEWINALPAQETPVEPEEPVEMVNQVPISTDTDGSIYNGTGYKDNVRLSSSGGVSSTALTGSVTTGFMPCKAGDVIRMQGATWLGNADAQLYYINFYDSSKTYLTGYTAQSYNGSFAGVSVVYDETSGITTWDTSVGPSGYLTSMQSAAYFRINAKGSGADLIVTVNQEIT